jgi:mRNA interferase MazF
VERGELWWALIDEKCPVVLLSSDPGRQVRAVQVVEPATPDQKRGFVLMSGEQAADAGERRRVIEEAGPATHAIGVEVLLGAPEGLAAAGVVRVALPQDGKIFCSWGTTLEEEHLIERIGVLSPAKLRQLDIALELAGEGRRHSVRGAS